MSALTRLRLLGGVWEGRLEDGGDTPNLRLRHRDEVVGTPEIVESETGGWIVRFRLPVERIDEGVQTFVIEDVASGETLASETIFAGPEAGHDLRAEVDLLRAELDMLKRAFRRHCAEG